jgi:dolichol-phosphate mannosyltransferase
MPITWRNRRAGESKFKIKEMGSRYLFIVLYLWLEKHLARGDYHRTVAAPVEEKVTKINA